MSILENSVPCRLRPAVGAGEYTQTFQFVATGNAELGLLPHRSCSGRKALGGSRWDVPAAFYASRSADAVLLVKHAPTIRLRLR